jgi:hypothetical protein
MKSSSQNGTSFLSVYLAPRTVPGIGNIYIKEKENNSSLNE